MSAFSTFLRRHCLYLAWFVSLIAVAGSLYLSEVLKYEPCKLCWFQRIFMYPQVFLLGIATYRNDKRIIPYVLPLCAIGGSISLYHYAEQKIPALGKVVPCTIGVPCTKDYLNFFGFITIPLLALTAFVLIFVLLWNGREGKEENSEEIGDGFTQ
ncbi:disulfide bond formation protein DsbB [Paenibacillus sophorae]|uniref:Disulfide bond formation protein B n=1 Tax=Paenibacillus sophorae TaxID=1333845 RepID=A0A1H8FPQ6_9BACL|nr:disulfide oxidoreductase [Paenibacillus sophorae]QWU13939.1 disulfide bond formation protein B [Paenibacillus sophorae]SEN33659.1 disulfide bond formation protein DsbB [Paenibacillus sophorae]